MSINEVRIINRSAAEVRRFCVCRCLLFELSTLPQAEYCWINLCGKQSRLRDGVVQSVTFLIDGAEVDNEIFWLSNLMLTISNCLIWRIRVENVDTLLLSSYSIQQSGDKTNNWDDSIRKSKQACCHEGAFGISLLQIFLCPPIVLCPGKFFIKT